MLRGTNVPMMMKRVANSLVRPSHSEFRSGPLFLPAEGDEGLDIASLRRRADIPIDRPSGSARPLIGPAIRFSKRVLRRGLRWYLQPIVAEQGRFNHATLDLIEGLRLRQEAMRWELESLREAAAAGSEDPVSPAPGEPLA